MANKSGLNLFQGLHISNVKKGVTVHGGNVKFEDTVFDNVAEPWDVRDGQVSISGTRIKNDPKLIGKSKSQVGYRRPNGPPLPAFCPRCKSVFSSTNYNVGSPEFWGFDNEETCPNCKFEHAKVAEGLFDLSKEMLEVIRAPDFTHAMLAQAGTVTSALIKGDITSARAGKEIKRISPRLYRLLKRAYAFGMGGLAVFGAVMGYLSYLNSLEQTEISKQSLELQHKQMLNQIFPEQYNIPDRSPARDAVSDEEIVEDGSHKVPKRKPGKKYVEAAPFPRQKPEK